MKTANIVRYWPFYTDIVRSDIVDYQQTILGEFLSNIEHTPNVNVLQKKVICGGFPWEKYLLA